MDTHGLHTEGARRRTSASEIAAAFGLDVVAVALFVVIGRRNHHEDGNVLVGAAKVAVPFLIGLVVGWVVARTDNAPRALRTGAVVWPCTVIVGLVLRRFAFQRGIAVAFVIVATLTLGLFLIGWRAVARALLRTA